MATTQIIAQNIRFDITSNGWRAHDAERDQAIDLLQDWLECSLPEQLADDVFVERLAFNAVRDVTVDWRCWQHGYVGEVPALMVTRVKE